jgi:hypothetical protein
MARSCLLGTTGAGTMKVSASGSDNQSVTMVAALMHLA